jgi:hypothetical protein
MAEPFNSIYKASQYESAVGIVLNSGVTVAELSVLHGATAGVAVASKALVLNSQKSISGLTELGVTTLTARALKLQDIGEDISGNPATGYVYLYIKSGELYTKNSSGVVTKIGAGYTKEFPFTDVLSVVCEHEFNNQFPWVQIIDYENKDLAGQVYYQSLNSLTVSFNSVRSGRVKVRQL